VTAPELPVFDADDHLNESEDTLTRHLPGERLQPPLPPSAPDHQEPP
jgi:hypothetical protein